MNMKRLWILFFLLSFFFFFLKPHFTTFRPCRILFFRGKDGYLYIYIYFTHFLLPSSSGQKHHQNDISGLGFIGRLF